MRSKLLLFGLSISLFAAQPWSKDYLHWTNEDVQHMLIDSPWAKQTQALFSIPAAEDSTPPTGPNSGAASGAAGPGSTVKWNGQPGRPLGELPSLPVTVRWDSALPIHQALLRSDPAEANLKENQVCYEITVLGLWPGKSQAPDGSNFSRMRAELVQAARLLRRGKPALMPADVQLNPSTGAIHLFFSETDPIGMDDKEVTFITQFGPMTVQKKFRLKDMVYHGKLEL